MIYLNRQPIEQTPSKQTPLTMILRTLKLHN